VTQKSKTKRLPLGSYTFAQIIDGNYLYADKTQYIYDLLKQQKEYFLSRPRRFRKTLFLHTLTDLFSGNRKRFKGLWIDKSDYDFPFQPVISLSMSLSSPTTA
jgi:hypothetical protein